MHIPLSARLTYRIMAVVLAMTAVIAGVVYYAVRAYMLSEAKEIYLGILLKSQESARRKLSDVYVATKNNVHDIERDIEHPDLMFGHVERIARLNSPIVSSYLLFEPNYYPGKGRTFIPIARRITDDSIIVATVDTAFHNDFFDVWTPRQLQKDESTWTKAYLESPEFAIDQKRRLLTSYTVPIHNRHGRPVALLWSDVSLESLRRGIMQDMASVHKKFELGCNHHSYSFAIDQEGTYILHPDEQLMISNSYAEKVRKTPNSIDDDIVLRMRRGQSGEALMDIDGVPSWILYRKLKYIGWTLAIVVPEEVIYKKARTLNGIILLVMLLGMAAIYFICRRQIKVIADPVDMQTANFEHELKIANAIQMAMLPKTLVTPSDAQPVGLQQDRADTLRVELHASLAPARDVGGDLYDYFLRDDRLFFCIGDVSGKGVPAALIMALVKAMFRSESRRADSAATITAAINHNFCEDNAADYFVTMFVGILDTTTGHLDFCNAGHEWPIIAGHQLRVKHNLPVGALSDWEYEGEQVQLHPGDMLFLYTDGLSEAENAEHKMLGRERVLELARQHAADAPDKFVGQMEAAASRHAGGAPQNDDITMLAIRWCPDRVPLQLSIGASMDDIGRLEPFIREAADRSGLSDREAKRLRLAVEEDVANIINYGQATAITLWAAVDGQTLVLTIDDDGQPFDPTQDSPTDLTIPADQRPPGGLGIMFLQTMADGLTYQRADGHNILRIEKLIK